MYRLGEKYLSVEKETAKRMFEIIFGWKMFRGKDRGSKREREFEVFSENENKRNYNGKL